ncbi:MAG: hypothetical protein OEY96_01745 [Gammaproteobacteria bacterium]|nr:hypothetical protein [Gammaproteobacteria bacterium]
MAMGDSIDKSINVQTIKMAPWFLLVWLIIFIIFCFYVEPNFLVFAIGIPLGLFFAFVLPFFWRRNYGSWGFIFVVISQPYFFENSLNGHQAFSLSMFMVSLIWLVLKHRLISYVENNDNK